MSTYKKILLLADASMRETEGLRRARHLAWMEGAELHLCLVDYSAAIQAVGALGHQVMQLAKQAFIEQREHWLLQQAQAIENSGIQVHTEMIWGHPAYEKALAKILTVQPDLVIKDIAREPLLRRTLVTPLDTQLLRLCPCPLMLVRDTARDPPQRILAAIDIAHPAAGAENFNQRIVAAARGLADNCKASLDLAYAFEDLPTLAASLSDGETFLDSTIAEELRDMQAQELADFARRQGLSKEHSLFLSGPPCQAIVELSKQIKVDVVVVGTVYHAAVDRYMLGSTAEALVHRLDCDVLVVKPGSFIEQLNETLSAQQAQKSAVSRVSAIPAASAAAGL